MRRICRELSHLASAALYLCSVQRFSLKENGSRSRLIDALKNTDLVIVGCGLYGMTIAEIASRTLSLNCLILEKRSHIGGNAYSYFDERSGIEIHKYGTHLFHTNVEKIFNYVKTFTEFNSYTHRVFATFKNRIYTLPFNLHTLNQIYDQVFSPENAKTLLNEFRNSNFVKSEEFQNLESKAISMVGKDIYQKLIEGYTIKQWETHPSQLPSSIISRLPVRTNYDDRYFSDKYQGLPLFGYVNWFNKMLNSQRIKIFVDVDYFDVKKNLFNLPTIYTGAIDRYFNYCFGELGWRTLNFETETLSLRDFQGTAVMNYTDIDVPFTRIHEYKHLHPEREYKGEYTVISREYSRLATRKDEPYYPINSLKDRDMLTEYRKKALLEKNVHFGGRLGSYLYLDMHMAIGSAIQFMENDFSAWFERAQKSYEQEDNRK